MRIDRFIIIFFLCLFAACVLTDAASALTMQEYFQSMKIQETNIKTETLYLLAIFIFILAVVPRKYFLLPFILAACFVPADQRVIVERIDLTVLRMLIIVGVLKLCFFGGRRAIKPTKFDMLLVSWAIGSAVIYMIRVLSFTAFINRCGFLFDVLGLYWLFRQSIRSWDDVKFIIKAFAACALIMLPLVVFERATTNNLFSFFGRSATAIRDGAIRCSASFPHPIMMGIFWASLLPLFLGMSKISKSKIFCWSAAIACIFFVVASNSSTPAGLLVVIALFFPLFRWRQHTWSGVKAFFLLLLALHVAKRLKSGNPVWHLLQYMDVTGSGKGWHRYHLIDQFIKRFNEWWLLGTNSTAHWDVHGMLVDVTNQYVLIGVRGGLLALGLFVALVINAFRCLVRSFQTDESHEVQWLSWCLCVSLVAQLSAFIGVSLFGQMTMLWYLQLAIIGFVYEQQANAKKAALEKADSKI